MSNFQGPASPHDIRTVLTRAYNSSSGTLKVSGSIVARAQTPTLATHTSNNIGIGGSEDFVIDVDVDGNSIPNAIYVPQVVIVPSATTIFRLRFFATAARSLVDPMWYHHPYGAMDEDYANDATGFWFFNRDSDNPNRIFGQLSVDPLGSNAASFNIFVLFVPGG